MKAVIARMPRVSRMVGMAGMLCLLWGMAGAQVASGYVMRPVGSEVIAVSGYRVTTLVFPMAIRSGVRVSPDVKVEKVKGTENVLVLRAARAGFVATNLAVFGVDGRVYGFTLEYADTAVAWQYRVIPLGDSSRGLILTGLPADETRLSEDAKMIAAKRPWMSAVGHMQKMRATVTGIWSTDSLIWIAGRIKNRSRLDFNIGLVRLFTEDRKRVKRMAVQQADLEPVFTLGTDAVPGETTGQFVLAYRAIAAPPVKRLILEVAERDRARVIRVQIPFRKILAARKP